MTTETRAVDVFVAAGLVAHDEGVLDRALYELGIRLELKGAGDLLRKLTEDTCWSAHEGHERCPSCGAELIKRDPSPHPKPPPPPKPPDPPKPPPRPGGRT